jgi:hypothetical protein
MVLRRPVELAGLTRHLNRIWLVEPIRSRLCCMRRRFLILMLAFLPATALPYSVLQNSLGPASATSDEARSEVVLAKLSRPVYPLLARRTWVTGDVNLLMRIRQDGSVESAVIVSGPLLLRQASVESARQSKFECQGCNEAVTPYSLLYTFELFRTDCHVTTGSPSSNAQQDEKPRAQASQSQNHVTVVDEGGFCEGVFAHRVRSAKCLYLWRCGWRT